MYKVSKLQEMTSYNFRIYASNEEGDGHYSEIYTFVTQRALPPALKGKIYILSFENHFHI